MGVPFTSPVVIFALLTVLILCVPLLARAGGVPAFVALILAGVAVGPSGLHLLARGPELTLLSTTGMLYILFLAGLEVDLHQFRKQQNRGIGFGLLTFSLAQATGTVLGLYLFRGQATFGWPAAILFGSLFASHTIMTYPIASRLGLARNNAVAVTLGATIVTDSLALLVLAITAHRGQLTLGYGVQILATLLLLGLVSLYLLPRLGRWFYRNLPGDDGAEYLFLFSWLLIMATLAQMGGLEPLLGAFLAGLALNRLVPEQSRLMNRVQFVGNTLFIPLVLLSVGMVVDARSFFGGSWAWTVAGSMLVTTLAVKLLSAKVAQKIFGYSSDQGGVIFGLIVNKAAFTLAAALVGYECGLLNKEVLNGAIFVIIVTCMIGPWVTEHFGRRLALQANEPMAPKAALQPQRLLIPLANPASVHALMDVAFLVRDRRAAQPVFPLAVAEDGPEIQTVVGRIENMLSQAVVHAAAADVPVHAETRVDLDVAAGIVRAVKELRTTCLIIGWNGEVTAPRLVFGRVVDRLLRHTTELLLVCKIGQPLNTFRRLVLIVPPLASRLSGFEEAVRTIKRLAFHAGMKLVVVCLRREETACVPVIESAPPQVPVTCAPLEVWSGLWPTLTDTWRLDDLVVLMSCRDGGLAWQPGLDRMPQRFVQEFPPASLMVMYPAELASSESANPEPDRAPVSAQFGLLVADHVRFDLRLTDPHEAIEAIVNHYLSQHGMGSPERAWLLAEALSQSSLEITRGVALLHVHYDEIDQPVLLLGISPAGLTIHGIPGPVTGVFLLLSPATHPPEEHLHTLSEVARMVLAAPHLDRLAQATTYPDLRALFGLDAEPPPAETSV